MSKKKYFKVETGIRKRKSSNGWLYCTYGQIKKKPIPEKEFKTLRQAKAFREKFISEQIIITPEINKEEKKLTKDDLTFGDVWLRYKSKMIENCVVTSTKTNRLDKEPFLEGLFDYILGDISPSVITEHLENEKAKCLAKAAVVKANVEARDSERKKLNLPVEKFTRRCNFNDDLKFLTTVFNWYVEEFEDTSFNNPILKKHKTTKKNKGVGFIKYPPSKEKVMSPEETIAFWNGFEDKTSVFYDLAVFQYFLVNRISEPCGVQLQDFDLRFRKLWVRNVAIWGKDKKFLELKPVPKNDTPEPVYLNDTLIEIIKRRLNAVEKGCNFLFQLNGRPLGYREIQYQFNKALENAGLYPRFSATHFNRYSGGSAVRKVAGLDHAQASGRWKDSEMAQHYCSLDQELQREGTIMHEELIRDLLTKSI